MQVLRAGMVIDSIDTAFQQAPKVVDVLRMHLPPDIFVSRMVHEVACVVIFEELVGRQLVGIDRGPKLNLAGYNRVYGL